MRTSGPPNVDTLGTEWPRGTLASTRSSRRFCLPESATTTARPTPANAKAESGITSSSCISYFRERGEPAPCQPEILKPRQKRGPGLRDLVMSDDPALRVFAIELKH